MTRVLIVEDDEILAQFVVEGLRRDGLAVDGGQALSLCAVNAYDVVILDRDIPVVHGDDVCRAIVRDSPTTAVLMLTALHDLASKVEGFALGADDYLGKPFDYEELLSRVRALSRRSRAVPGVLLRHDDLVLDATRRYVTRDGVPVTLTRKEFGVLEELMRADGGVVSAEYLLEKVWDENADPFTNVVRVTMGTLRRKLGMPALIETVRGVGYRL